MMTLQTVSMASILGMFFTLLISIGLPIALLITVRKKWKGEIYCFLLGACVFFVAAMVLEQLMHVAVLGLTGNLLTNNIWLYALYGGLAAAIFEETGRLVAMKRFMRKRLTTENALMYGVGHGGFEAILIVGLSYISNIMVAILINTGSMNNTISAMDEASGTAMIESLSALWTTPAQMFYLAGVERICAITLQIALSVLMYCGVRYEKLMFAGMAYAAHFLVDFGTVLLSSLAGVLITEIVLVAATAAVVVFTYMIWKKLNCEKSNLV